ncbi:MAG: hypothetical protein E7222_10700 [Clostridiales bacterium]|nr:hypothetical protein [Clostridiales bacterium]
MAKYVIVPDKHEKYEKNYVFPFINIVPAVVWSIPIHQKLFPEAGFWIVALYTIAFIGLYLYFSMKPIVAAVPCIAGVVIYTLTAWIPLNHIENNVVRIILKIITLGIVIIVEFAIWTNATLPWLQEKTYKPTIRKVDE